MNQTEQWISVSCHRHEIWPLAPEPSPTFVALSSWLVVQSQAACPLFHWALSPLPSLLLAGFMGLISVPGPTCHLM